MHQVQLADQVYQKARRRATEAGFASVDEYLAEVVTQDIADPGENLDRYFTPERLAHIDKAAAEIKAGKGYTPRQAKAERAKRRAERLRSKSS
jgi:hypothetical protein